MSQSSRVVLVWYWRVEPLGFEGLASGGTVEKNVSLPNYSWTPSVEGQGLPQRLHPASGVHACAADVLGGCNFLVHTTDFVKE